MEFSASIWRDYWQRLSAQKGEGIWQDQEEDKTGYTAANYTSQLPEDVSMGTTGMVCLDSFSQDLQEVGYLHNHGRIMRKLNKSCFLHPSRLIVVVGVGVFNVQRKSADD